MSFRARGGSSSQRGKTTARVTAPVPVNLPSRRQERAGDLSLGSSGHGWGSPSSTSSTTLATSPSAASSPATETVSNAPASGNPAGQGSSDSPQPDTSHGSPLQKPAPRAWGVVTQTQEQSLDDFPTAAEAAKKLQEQNDHSQVNGGPTTNNNSSTKRTTPASKPSSGEPMSKTVSTLSSGADNWDEADEDEGVDFLNAEAIEFADGSVIVAAAVAHSAETQKDTPLETAASEPKQEERVVDRGEVDFNRSLPNRPQSGSGSSLYHPHSEPVTKSGTQDRPHQSLWNNAPGDRRLSADRTHGQHSNQHGHHSNQRPESFGNRDGYHGSQRRESFGHKDSFSGSRRDSGGYRDPYDRHDRRDSYNRPGGYNHNRDTYHHHRDHDYSSERRHSYDRSQPYTSDRYPDRNQRDIQLLTRPKEASPTDRQGPHDLPSTGADAHPSHGQHGPHDSIPPSFNHFSPPGAIEYDRPPNTEEQSEIMKSGVEAARRRREEEERERQESAARARAKADELARKADEKRALEAAAVAAAAAAAAAEATAKESATTEEEEVQPYYVVGSTSAPSKSSPPVVAKPSQDPVDQQHKPLTESERKEGMAKWRAYPEKLMAETAEKQKRNIQDYRERQALKALSSPSPSQATSITESSKSSETAKEAKLVAAQSPNSTENQKAVETTGSNTPLTVNQPTRDNKDERGSSETPVTIVSSSTQSLLGEKTLKADRTADVANDAVLKSEDKSHGHQESTAAPGAQANQPHAQADKPAPKERRNGKAGRAERGNADTAVSWRKAETKSETSSEPKTAATPTSGANSDTAHGHVKKAQVEKAGQRLYPAKLKGVNGVPTISQITKIHARLALNAAGSTVLEKSNEIDTPGAITNKATDTLMVKEKGVKRHSLLNASTPIIFPSVVESAAKKRGSMNFMVESEGTDSSTEQKAQTQSHAEPATVISPSEDSKTPLPQEQSQESIASVDDSAKRAWESASVATSDVHAETITSKQDDGHHPGHQGMPVGPGVFMVNGGAPGVVGTMTPQPMWNGPINVDSTSQAGATMTPPYHMMMPFFPQGYPVNAPPMIYMYPRGPIAHMGQYPGGVVPAHGSMPHASRDGGIGPAAAHGSSDMANASGDMALDGTAAVTNSPPFHGPPLWQPHLSAAGETSPHQPSMSFMLPISQQASLIAAANINRVPQPRPYPPHTRLAGPTSLETGYQEGAGSAGSTDTWGNNSTLSPGNANASSPANNNGRIHNAHGASGSSPTWNGRMHSNANTASNGVSATTNTYNTYGGYTQPSTQHGFPGSSHRGGRGGFNRGEYKAKGGFTGGHLNHVHHPSPAGSYSYGHGTNNISQHGGTSPGTPSGLGSMDTPHHGHHQGIQQSRGGAMNHEGNSGTNSFGSSSYPHRSGHASGTAAAAATTSSGLPF
ncbi:MAG: hypothetical protein J3Q66DRAFT_387196 [Benniella sp.]|nr:MAG: hypothetical protein J3Q66DRAFT_387196 [Benniella sp.]